LPSLPPHFPKAKDTDYFYYNRFEKDAQYRHSAESPLDAKRPWLVHCAQARVVFHFSLFLRELILAHSAQGALEVLRNILPSRAGSDAGLGVAQFFVVYPTANVANILFHNEFLLIFMVVFVFLYGLILAAKGKSFCDFLTFCYFIPAISVTLPGRWSL
jgi:hypothetical protein